MSGAAIALVVFLAYVLLVQAMTAAIVLLAEFTILRVQALRALLRSVETPQAPRVAAQAEPQERPAPVLVEQRPYRLGGDLRWH
jgi:membrane protein implicated in regulation of membrane protease activity